MFIFGKCSAFAIENLQQMQPTYRMMTRRYLQVYSTPFYIYHLSQTWPINGSVIGSEKRDYPLELLKVSFLQVFIFVCHFSIRTILARFLHTVVDKENDGGYRDYSLRDCSSV